MRKGTDKRVPKVGRAVRFQGIHFAAKELGVSVEHLRFVLRGERTSQRLMDRVKDQFPSLLGAA